MTILKCHDCGENYDPRDETKINGKPMHLCIPCAEDYLSPSYVGYDWED